MPKNRGDPSLNWTPPLGLLAISLLAAALPEPLANAQDHAALRATSGSATFYGDLSSERAVPTQAFGGRLGWGAFGLGFDALSATTRHEGDRFAFAEGERVRVLAFLLLPHACWRAPSTAELCGGLGLGTVNVNGPTNRQDYGSWHYEAAARAHATDAWTVELVAKYVGKVEQKVATEASEFGFGVIGLGVGYVR